MATIRYNDLTVMAKTAYRIHYDGIYRKRRIFIPRPERFDVRDCHTLDSFIRAKAEDFAFVPSSATSEMFLSNGLMDYVADTTLKLTSAMNSILNDGKLDMDTVTGRRYERRVKDTPLLFDSAMAFFRPSAASSLNKAWLFTYVDYIEAFHVAFGELESVHWKRDDLAISCAKVLARSLGLSAASMMDMGDKGNVFVCMLCPKGSRIPHSWIGLVCSIGCFHYVRPH